MNDPTPILARMPTGSTLHLHAVPPDDGHVNHPAEVAIFRVPSGPGGCMVWALYDGVWHPNLGERYALRLLMDAAPRPAEPTTPVRIPAPMIAAAREATGLPSGEAVRRVLSEVLAIGSRVEALEARLAALEGGR